jgi:predicted enzyme related to lactoylglutathione lyase
MKIALVSVPVKDPIEAHKIYTTKLGFISKEFDEKAQIAIVVSKQDPKGTAILLEPCLGSFAEKYQTSAYESNLPVIVFGAQDVEAELARLKSVGVILRPELDKPDWGITNMFEDGCGNYVMMEQL